MSAPAQASVPAVDGARLCRPMRLNLNVLYDPAEALCHGEPLFFGWEEEARPPSRFEDSARGAPGKTPIAKHHRVNHEATDVALIEIQGLAHAIDLITPDLDLGRSAAAEAFSAVLSALMARLEDLDRLRAAEWAGIGGDASDLSPEDRARAQGEKEAV